MTVKYTFTRIPRVPEHPPDVAVIAQQMRDTFPGIPLNRVETDAAVMEVYIWFEGALSPQEENQLGMLMRTYEV